MGAPDNEVAGTLDDGDQPRPRLEVGQFLAVGLTGRGALVVAALDILRPRAHGLGLHPVAVGRLLRPAKTPWATNAATVGAAVFHYQIGWTPHSRRSEER